MRWIGEIIFPKPHLQYVFTSLRRTKSLQIFIKSIFISLILENLQVLKETTTNKSSRSAWIQKNVSFLQVAFKKGCTNLALFFICSSILLVLGQILDVCDCFSRLRSESIFLYRFTLWSRFFYVKYIFFVQSRYNIFRR